MNQQINLYLPEFRQKKDWLDFRAMVALVGLVGIILLVVSGAELWSSFSLGRQLAQKQTDLETTRDRTNQLIDSFGLQSEDRQLMDEVATLEENLQGKRTMLQFLDGRDLGNTGGFSEFLADLSRFHVPGLRLTGIELQQGGRAVVLNGEVLRAENVPLYLRNLRNGQTFAGKNFETINIQERNRIAGGESVMAFNVATTGATN